MTNSTLRDVQTPGQVRLVPLSLTKLCSLCLSTSPGLDWDQTDIQNVEVFMKFFVTGHCTHTSPDYMRNGEPLETVRRIDIQISQFDLKHVFLGFK